MAESTLTSTHPSMVALYEAAREHGDLQPADVARRLNMSQQRLKNWDGRGISKEGALSAQEIYGIDGLALMRGVLRRLPSQTSPFVSQSKETRLDPEMIAESYAALSEIYLEERGVPFDLTQEPERFVLVYEARSRMTKNPSASDERRFGARVAEIVRLTGAELHGSRDGVPAEGDDKGPVARGVQRKKG